MSTYTLETGEYVYRIKCQCCGERKKRVWGFVSKAGDAHAVYYALLNIEEEQPRVGLTLSVGPWWDGTQPSQRSWVHLNVWTDKNEIHMNIREPQESNSYPWEMGGVPLDREKAKANNVIDEIWSVADFVVATDPALSSYLDGNSVNPDGRQEREGESAAHSC